MDMLSSKQKMLVIIGIIIVAIVIILYYINSTKDIYNYEELVSEEEGQEEKIENDEEEKIIVHVTGAVQNEGVVEVKENARINDVIYAAGGLTDDADLDNVNLAYVVEDGQKIYIPSKLDNNENIDDGNVVLQSPGKNVIKEEETGESSGLVNINTADKMKLQELPGIGSSTAEKIITYRKENGKFKSIEDIKNVSGIGDAKFEMIKKHICI